MPNVHRQSSTKRKLRHGLGLEEVKLGTNTVQWMAKDPVQELGVAQQAGFTQIQLSGCLVEKDLD